MIISLRLLIRRRMCRGQFSNSLAGTTETSDGFRIVDLCGHRRRCRPGRHPMTCRDDRDNRSKYALGINTILAHCFGVAAAEAPGQLSLEKNSFYLSSAGFRIQLANDPAEQKALRTLPAHRFVASGVGEAVRYFYAEPQHCVCIFVGIQQAYNRYLEMLSQPLKPTDDVAPDYKTQAGVLLAASRCDRARVAIPPRCRII
jgi:hypothetical protein